MPRALRRLILVHWNEAECTPKARLLREAGYAVAPFHKADGRAETKAWRDNPPDAFVVDLSRLPSHGVAIGGYIRDVKALREKPIVFVGGEPEKVTRARKLLPDAAFTNWEHVGAALAKALASPPAAPLKIQSTSGYSGTPLPKKLGIKPDSVVALLGAPDGFLKTLGDLPDGARTVTAARAAARTIVLFVKSAADLARRFDPAAKCMDPGGSALWIAWPKKTSALAGDLGENEVRAFGLARGLVDYKVCAIDHTWSGLCFARRRP